MANSEHAAETTGSAPGDTAATVPAIEPKAIDLAEPVATESKAVGPVGSPLLLDASTALEQPESRPLDPSIKEQPELFAAAARPARGPARPHERIRSDALKRDGTAAKLVSLAMAVEQDERTLGGIKPPKADGSALPPRLAGAMGAETASDEASAKPPRKRFAMLAATVAMAAAIGAMGGALGASGLSLLVPAKSEAAAPAPVAAVPSEEARALRNSIAQLRTEVGALKTSLEGGAKSTSGQITKMSERFDKIERAQAEPSAKIAKMMEALERIERHAAEAAKEAKETTGSVAPQRQAAAAAAPSQPPVVQGWRVREVYRGGVAVLQGPRYGLLEVETGDMVPGVGRVEAVRRQDGRWIVVTSRGVIPSAR